MFVNIKHPREESSSLRFLFGEPKFIHKVEPNERNSRNFEITDDGLSVPITERLQQKAAAKACSGWIRDKVEIKSLVEPDFLHGKMYHIRKPNTVESALLGSSNFTVQGLGLSAKPNMELNLVMNDHRDIRELIDWFDALWDGKIAEVPVVDVKEKVLGYLEMLYAENDPQFVFFKTLYHLFIQYVEDQEKGGLLLKETTHFLDSQIWQALFAFQKDGVKGAINKILKHGGCIIADSVGLGKTYEALAIIKYFESLNLITLVICPKKLSDNWTIYQAHKNHSLNPVTKDRFDFSDDEPLREVKTMLQILDLSSTRGISFSIVMNNSTNAIEAYKISTTRKTSELEEKITFTITGTQALSEFGALKAEISSLNQSASATSTVNVGNSTFNRIIDKVFSFLFTVQGNNPSGANVTYTKELTPVHSSTAVHLGVSLGISVLDVEIGGGGEFEEGASMTVTEGKWIYGHHFPTTTFAGTIPDVPVDHQQVLQQIIDDIPLSLRILIGVVNFFTGSMKDQNFYIGNQGSYISIPEGAMPPSTDTISCTSWGWYGKKISDRFENLKNEKQEVYEDNRKNAEEIYGMKYGIGGFYQFEPYNMEMLDTCWLTIKYTSDEVQGVDESSLAVYWEDKANHTWHYINSTVDLVEKKVTAPVKFLGLFPVAPSQPFGKIELNPSADSLFADSLSTLSVMSNVIFNNDSSLLKDNELFTVSASLGQKLNTDLDTIHPCIQVSSLNGKIQFDIRSSSVAGDVKISAFSLNGSARGDTAAVFFDTVAPGPL